MAPNFQSSFIPKEPITEEVFKKKKAGIFGVLAVSIFVASIVIAGAVFAYKSILDSEIKNLKSQLVESEKSIDRKTIDEISQFSKKLKATKAILSKHQAVSGFLTSLSSSTVSLVQFTDFRFGGSESEKLTVNMHGKAVSYSAIALQENVFSQNKYFKSTSFSNLALTDKGMVAFDLKISVDPQIFNYTP